MCVQVYGRKQIVMEKDEVDAIKKFDDPGLFLIGFKPMEKLKPHHHIRPSVFIYPEEDEVKGRSTDSTLTMKKTIAHCIIKATALK